MGLGVWFTINLKGTFQPVIRTTVVLQMDSSFIFLELGIQVASTRFSNGTVHPTKGKSCYLHHNDEENQGKLLLATPLLPWSTLTMPVSSALGTQTVGCAEVGRCHKGLSDCWRLYSWNLFPSDPGSLWGDASSGNWSQALSTCLSQRCLCQPAHHYCV